MDYLLLTTAFPPPIVGGAGVYLYNIFRRFPAGEVTIFTEKSRAPELKDESSGLRFIRRGYIKPGIPRDSTKFEKFIMIVCWTVELIGLCLKEKPRCIFIGQLYPFFQGYFGLLARRLFGIPYIIFTYAEELTTIQDSKLRYWLVATALRQADRVITISRFTVDQLVKAGVSRQKISLVYPGVDTQYFHPGISDHALRSKLGLKDSKVILTIGRLTKRKGHAKVIAALPKVLEVVPNAKYVVVGTDVGEGKTLAGVVSRLGLERQVLFIGRIHDHEAPEYYAACDVFVMANYEIAGSRDTEGFGIVFLEANACGKAVIGGRAGGAVDAIADGESGLLVDANDPSALANAIVRLLCDENYAASLGANGRKRAVESFNWERAAMQVREIGLAAAHGRQLS